MLKGMVFCHLLKNLIINMVKKQWILQLKQEWMLQKQYQRVVQKTAEATGDLIGNKIADKITSICKPKEKEKTKEIEEIYTPPEKRQQIIDDLRLF